MSERDNQQLIEDQFAALNAHDLDRYAKPFADSHVWESDTLPAPVRGPEGAKQAMGMYFKAFPDLHVETQQIIASGDHVVLRWRATGTHK
jgi:ketosteroid isomerase-like protein